MKNFSADKYLKLMLQSFITYGGGQKILDNEIFIIVLFILTYVRLPSERRCGGWGNLNSWKG
jgi:hypothetical protein